MKDFDALKDLWQQSKPAEQKTVDLQAITRQSKDTRTKLFRQLLFGGITLFFTVVFIIWTIYFSNVKLTSNNRLDFMVDCFLHKLESAIHIA